MSANCLWPYSIIVRQNIYFPPEAPSLIENKPKAQPWPRDKKKMVAKKKGRHSAEFRSRPRGGRGSLWSCLPSRRAYAGVEPKKRKRLGNRVQSFTNKIPLTRKKTT